VPVQRKCGRRVRNRRMRNWGEDLAYTNGAQDSVSFEVRMTSAHEEVLERENEYQEMKRGMSKFNRNMFDFCVQEPACNR
jgi:hypothetical protein